MRHLESLDTKSFNLNPPLREIKDAFIAEPTLGIYEIYRYKVAAHASDILSSQKDCF